MGRSEYEFPDAEQVEELIDLLTKVQFDLPSRRERIATAALQGLLSSDAGGTNIVKQWYFFEDSSTAVIAVKLADALIAELDKEPGK